MTGGRMLVPVGILLGAIALAACSGTTAGRREHPDHPATRVIAVLNDRANRAFHSIRVPNQTFGLAGRLANPSSSVATSMTTDGGIWVRGGRYVLVLECVGPGQIEAATWIGQARARLTVACHPQPQQVDLYLTAPKAGALYLQFVAKQRETVAVAAKEGRLH